MAELELHPFIEQLSRLHDHICPRVTIHVGEKGGLTGKNAGESVKEIALLATSGFKDQRRGRRSTGRQE
jgi:hypothetical protein